MEHCQGLPSSERLLSAWGDFLSQEGQGQAWRLLEVGLIQQEVRRWIKTALLRNRGGREGFGLPCSKKCVKSCRRRGRRCGRCLQSSWQAWGMSSLLGAKGPNKTVLTRPVAAAKSSSGSCQARPARAHKLLAFLPSSALSDSRPNMRPNPAQRPAKSTRKDLKIRQTLNRAAVQNIILYDII